jgi:hypothetical protein
VSLSSMIPFIAVRAQAFMLAKTNTWARILANNLRPFYSSS